MNNVKLIHPEHGKGWFLTIGDEFVENTWAVTSLELLMLQKMITDNQERINKEVDETPHPDSHEEKI